MRERAQVQQEGQTLLSVMITQNVINLKNKH